ncbi:MAG: NUDIX domain-containing protein [Gaiellaceae bacterium]
MTRRRPRVVVYVTREHPKTGADELLVFDVVGDPQYTAVVPGGGIEPGETVEQAVAREVLEETGIEVQLVRDLGVVEQQGRFRPEFRHESHFVQAVPAKSAPDEWEHRVTGHGAESGALVRCRWVPVGAAELWGNRGELVSALIRERVVAYLTRQHEGRTELLTIEQGDIEAGIQVPAGRLDPGEGLEEGLAREVEEETGVTDLRVVGTLADADEFEQLYGLGAHRSYALHAEAADERDEWRHAVGGKGADAGFTYRCRWVPLDDCPPLWGKPDPLVEKLRRSITEG